MAKQKELLQVQRLLTSLVLNSSNYFVEMMAELKSSDKYIQKEADGCLPEAWYQFKECCLVYL